MRYNVLAKPYKNKPMWFMSIIEPSSNVMKMRNLIKLNCVI